AGCGFFLTRDMNFSSYLPEARRRAREVACGCLRSFRLPATVTAVGRLVAHPCAPGAGTAPPRGPRAPRPRSRACSAWRSPRRLLLFASTGPLSSGHPPLARSGASSHGGAGGRCTRAACRALARWSLSACARFRCLLEQHRRVHVQGYAHLREALEGEV